MSDLDSRIREWFDARLETMPCDDDLPVHDSLLMAAHAVSAVLDRHALHPDGGIGYEPDDGGKYEHMSSVCTSCGPPDEYAVRWPCPEVRAIAAALGIETEDDHH